jgi:transposase
MKKKAKRVGKFGVRYDDAFKADALKLCRESDKTIADVAELLGVATVTLEGWALQAAVDEGRGPAGALTTDERRELRRLRREVEDLRTANAILKKAEAFSAARKR